MPTQEELNQQLLLAMNDDNIEEVRNALDSGADIEAQLSANNFRDKATPLLIAAFKNKTDIGLLLLEKGANPNIQFALNDFSPLHLYSAFNNPIMVKALIDAGADKDAPMNGANQYNTPVHEAVDKNSLQVLKVLLKNGANPEGGDYSTLPLTQTRSIEATQLLIDHGAETIGVINFRAWVNPLIQNHAAALINKLTALAGLPDDIEQLNDAQKTLVTHLTAPYKAGNPTVPREALGNKSLIDYMQENKSQLLMFTRGYHGDKFLGGAESILTDVQQTEILFASIRKNPVNFIDDYRSGMQFKRQDDSATKIQALRRGGVARRTIPTIHRLDNGRIGFGI